MASTHKPVIYIKVQNTPVGQCNLPKTPTVVTSPHDALELVAALASGKLKPKDTIVTFDIPRHKLVAGPWQHSLVHHLLRRGDVDLLVDCTFSGGRLRIAYGHIGGGFIRDLAFLGKNDKNFLIKDYNFNDNISTHPDFKVFAKDEDGLPYFVEQLYREEMKTNDDIFPYWATVRVNKFDKTKRLRCMVTQAAFDIIEKTPDHLFKGDEVFWIERGEDYYATPHYAGKVAVRVERHAWTSIPD